MERNAIPHFATDQCARDWLDYGSYVDEDRRILYVWTPKAACTSIKQMLRSLLTSEPLQFIGSTGESTLAMMIHDPSQIRLPPLKAFSGEKLQDIMTGPGWFRFCVTRHPYDRFFSAWRHKVFLCEPDFEAYAPRNGRKFVEFADFVAQVVTNEDPFTCDPHWRAQVALLLPDDIAYNHVYDITDVSNLPGDLQNHLAKEGFGGQLAPLEWSNKGWAIEMDGFLTADVLESLGRFYRADFEWFGYFARRHPTAGAPSKAGELVNEFTDAVFDRNRAIAEYARAARQSEEREKERAQLESTVNDLRTMLFEKGAELERASQISKRQADSAKLRAELAKRTSDSEQLRRQIDSIHASICWRITWPIRWLHKQFDQANAFLSRHLPPGNLVARLGLKVKLDQPTDPSLLVHSFYRAAFGRLAEPEGLAHRIHQLESGVSQEDLAEELVGSAEFQSRHGSSKEVDIDYITALYCDVLGREPDSAGMANWLAVGQDGVTQGKVLAGIAGSSEALEKIATLVTAPDALETRLENLPLVGDPSLLVHSFYKAAFGRLADPEDLAHCIHQLKSGVSPEHLAEELVGSDEFRARHGSSERVDTDYLTPLYRDGLGREPDPEGLAYWLTEGGKGATRAEVLAAFAGSDEAMRAVATLLVNSLYKSAFGRFADEGGLAHSLQQLQSGVSTESLAEGLVASAEFQGRHGSSQKVDTEYLTALYRDALGREPDPEGLAYWLAEGEKGATRAKVLAGFGRSSEALGKALLRQIASPKRAYNEEWELSLFSPGWPRHQEFLELSDASLRDLREVRDLGAVPNGEVPLITIVRNEMARLPDFLRHYRELGVRRFIIVDHCSDDGTTEYLVRQSDVHFYRAQSGYHKAVSGQMWVTGLARRFAMGRWVLHVDADEHLVYEGMESHGITELSRMLESRGQTRLYAPMLDMYPSTPIGDARFAVGTKLIDVAPYFDPLSHDGFTFYERKTLPGRVGVLGYNRIRVFGKLTDDEGPAGPAWMEKFPLSKWHDRTAYCCVHCPFPFDENPSDQFGTLLHFRFLGNFVEFNRSIAELGETWDGGFSYRNYADKVVQNPLLSLFHAGSRYYRGASTLISEGFMKPIDWS